MNYFKIYAIYINKCQILATSYGTRDTNSTSGTNLNANVTADVNTFKTSYNTAMTNDSS
jgi:hypothetical protein